MKVTIKTLQGKPTEIEVSETDTLEELKAKISAELKVDQKSQKLVHVGKVLSDNTKKLSDYGIKDKDFIVLMITKAAPEKKEAAPAPKPASLFPQVPKKPTETHVPKPAPVPAPAAPASAMTDVKPAGSAPEIKKATSAEEQLVVGPELESTVKNLMEMGFSREAVQQALHAAFNNPDRATEYLLNGLPPASMEAAHFGADVRPGAEGEEAAMGEGSEGPEEGELEGEGFEGAEGEIPGIGNLEEIRARIAENPAYLQQLLQEIQTNNPDLYEIIQQNPQAIMQLLQGGAGPGAGAGGAGHHHHHDPGAIQVTTEEKAAIDRLKGLGFTEMQAAQAFMACEKNEMLAANFLFENAESFRAEMQDVVPGAPPMPGVPPMPGAPVRPAEVKKEEKKVPPEKKEEGSSLSLNPKPEEKKTG